MGQAAMRFTRVAASAALVTLLSVVSATAKPIATTAETNLRKGPGTDSEVLTLVPKGTTVEVGKCTNGWCEASLDGKDGFIISRNLGMGPRPAPRGRMGAVQVYDEGPVYGPPPVYYRPYPHFGYYPYGWSYRGWGWGWRGYW
jgi:uncharacterized protein YraI